MYLLFISLIFIFILAIIVFVFHFFKKEKNKHALALQNIQQRIEDQQKTLLRQKSDFLMLQNSSNLTENAMKKVVKTFNEIPTSDSVFLENHLKNLNSFSKNALDLIKIYGSFIKAP